MRQRFDIEQYLVILRNNFLGICTATVLDNCLLEDPFLP